MEVEKKQKILIAAGELISERGYHNVSVREICEAAGVTKPVLYYYFKDKEDVLAALINEGHSCFKELMDKYINQDASFEENLEGLYNVYLAYTKNFPYLVRISVHVQLSPLPKRIKILSSKRTEEIMELINVMFDKGIRGEYFKKEVEPEMLAYSLTAPFGVFIAQCVFCKNNMKPLNDNLKKYFNFWKAQFLIKGK